MLAEVSLDRADVVIDGMWATGLPNGRKPVSGKTGGLKDSMQHWPAVYPPEFEIPRFVVVGY